MFTNYVFLVLLSLGLFACGSENTDIDALIQAIDKIPHQPDTDRDPNSLDGRPTRVLKLVIDSNVPVGTLWVNEMNQSYPFFTKTFNNIDLPYSGSVTIPDVVVAVSMNQPARYTVSPEEVIITQRETTISQYFTFTDVLPALSAEFNSKEPVEKKAIVDLVNAVSVARDSLDLSKLDETSGQLDDLFLQYPENSDSPLYKRLASLSDENIDLLKIVVGL